MTWIITKDGQALGEIFSAEVKAQCEVRGLKPGVTIEPAGEWLRKVSLFCKIQQGA
jgi:hypothetical protein